MRLKLTLDILEKLFTDLGISYSRYTEVHKFEPREEEEVIMTHSLDSVAFGTKVVTRKGKIYLVIDEFYYFKWYNCSLNSLIKYAKLDSLQVQCWYKVYTNKP